MVIRRLARAVAAGVGLAVVGSVVIYSGAKIAQPFVILHQQGEEIAALERRNRDLAEQERMLLASVRYYRSTDGKVELRHEQGILDPGERYVRLLPAERFGPKVVSPPERPGTCARIKAAARRIGRRAKAALQGGLGIR
jgi:hypothetical protein